jgi:dienelactone hydrolase
VNDREGIYYSFGRALVEAGFAVLAPMNLAGIAHRNRVQRLALLAGLTLPGIEFARLRCLLDAVLALPQIDAQRVGMWGISLGGMATQFFAALEPRIGAAISSAWFNHRANKLAIPDPRYSCYLDTDEAHIVVPGWLTAFADDDLLSLICPRPILIQTGKADGIAWWPQVTATFDRARAHYDRLNCQDRIALDLHDGVHEVRLDSGLAWMRRFVADASDEVR